MDDHLIFPIPKSSKADGIVSIRVQKYTRVYSARRSATRETQKKSIKHSEAESLNLPQKSSIDMSRISFHSEPIQNLQKAAKSLLYDVQKAESDRLELIRDLSTYECNLSKAVNLIEKLEVFVRLSKPLPDMVDIIELNTEEENFCFNRIEEGLVKVSLLEKSRNRLIKPEKEEFSIRKSSLAHALSTVFKGVTLVSGVYMMASLVSDPWLENLFFRVTDLKGKSYTLKLKQKISNNLQTKQQCIQVIKTKLLPFLCIQIENSESSLIFDKKQTVEHYCMVVDVKGFRLCNVVASVKSDTQTLLEIPELEQSIFIEFKLNLKDQLNLKKILKLVIKQLFYDNKKNVFFWGSTANFFAIKEKNSKFLNEEFIKSATQDMGNFTQTYTFELSNGKVSCFTDREKVLVQILKNKVSEEFNQESKNFGFLECLQCISVRSAPVTFSKSLELEYLLSKLFPQ